MSIIGLSLIGLKLPFDLMIFVSDGNISYDEGGDSHVATGILMLIFLLIFIIQNKTHGLVRNINDDLIDDEEFI
jgi:hypothetical protein